MIILVIAGILYFYLIRSQPVSTTPSVTGFFKSILPFSNTPSTITNTADTPLLIGDTGSNNSSNILKTLPRLRQHTTEPIAGNTIMERNKEVIKDRVKVTVKETSIRYMDRASGHMFDAVTTDKDPKKISNTTIPKVYEAIFTPTGESVITRFLDGAENIITYYITLKDKKPTIASTTLASSSTPPVDTLPDVYIYKDVSGTYLAKNIKELALSTDGKKMLSLVYGSDNGIISIIDSALKSTTILSSPLKEWLLSYPTDSKAIITTKPSGITYGYSYILNTQTGSLTKLIGNILGLTVLPNKDASMYLIGQASSALKMFYITSSIQTLNNISINTLPEKCVWSHNSSDTIYCAVPTRIPNAIYPDDWYKGRLFFNDSLWKINLKTGETNLVSNLLQESSQSIDAINLQLSASDEYLTFINKRDLTLWGIDLTR